VHSISEDINLRSRSIDSLPTLEVLRLINDEDAQVAGAVARQMTDIAAVVDSAVAALSAGGRLIYVGAGTSGRLAVLDAAECIPTFGLEPGRVLAVLAGGPAAMTASIEAAEDDADAGSQAMRDHGVGPKDLVLGIASSGRTPFVVGALRQARELGAAGAALVGNADGPVAAAATLVIAVHTGAEVLAGSTRMKAGTAQKMVLNMISTAAMVRLGRTYGNLMVDLRATNEKLRVRACRIVAAAAETDEETAARALAEAAGEVKTAIVTLKTRASPAQARIRLANAHGVLRKALEETG
jgi:N-acetylmuramic acid 6-phosphate etherase